MQLRCYAYGKLYKYGWDMQFPSNDRAHNAHNFAEWFLTTHSAFDVDRDVAVAWNSWWTEIAE